MLWDHRPGQNRFAGIVLQEYSPARRELVGARHNIFKGTPLGLTERRISTSATAGTTDHRGGRHRWGHAVTMARSRALLEAVQSCTLTSTS